MQAKRYRILALAAAAALALAGCWGGSGASSGPAPTPAASAAGAARMGLGIAADFSENNGTGKADLTAAGVLLDENGRILQCVIDAVQGEMTAGPDGTVTAPEAPRTRQELGEEYGMKKASGIGREWNEQADAFAAWAKGKTAAEVAALETKDGRAADLDLLSGCTIRVAPLMQAVEKACARAADTPAAAGDTLALGAQSAASAQNASDDADGKAQITVTFVLLAKNSDGKVTGAAADEAEAAFRVDTAGSLIAPKDFATKAEQGEAYGMKNASGIEKEWYEQAEAFCAWLRGKTAAEIRGVPEEGDADLTAVCTLDPSGLLRAAAKAAG
jgi:hypothetical protein